MAGNQVKIILRNLIRHKIYSGTNIFGLTVSLACCIIIFLWTLSELSFDRFHTGINRISKVMINEVYPNGRIDTYDAPTVMIGEALRKDIPEIEEVVQMSWDAEMLVKYQDKRLNETGLYADSTLFTMFSFPIISGNRTNPLQDLHSIAISEKLAGKLFGDEDPIGKILDLNHGNRFAVASVFRDVPLNSSLQFDFIISFELWKKENTWAQHWRSGATQAFVALAPGSDFVSADAKVRQLIKKNCADCNREAFLYPFRRLYLHGKFENGRNTGGRITRVIIFGSVALLILLMAGINFTTLSTARASTRSREIGIRKSIGASRLSIGLQFLGESVLLSFLSLFFAVLLVASILPWINEITGKSLQLDFGNPQLAAGVLGITLLSGLMAGLYPAFYLSSLRVASILKNTSLSLKGGSLRKVLVITQFAISIVLITGSMIIYRQLTYISEKDLGFDKNNIIVVSQSETFGESYYPLKNELLQIPAVRDVAFVGSNLFQVPITTTDPAWPGKPANSSLSFKVLRCDEGFIPAMDIDLLAGRNFKNGNSDSSNYIINEKAMLAMGLTKENVIGAKLEMWNGKGEIIGLTDDFINGNLHQATEPLILMFTTWNGFNYYIKTAANADKNQTLTKIEAVTRKYAPDHPFKYTFLDRIYDQEYERESFLGKLSLGFTLIAVVICCLGLLGLTTFATEQRVKEIGIRKTLGASVMNIVVLLSMDFVKLVAVAGLIAVPVAYYFSDRWLTGFAYRIKVEWWLFIAAGLLAVFIALAAVSFQTIRAATANPVNSLKSE